MPDLPSTEPDEGMRHGPTGPPALPGTPLADMGKALRQHGFAWFFADIASLPADLAPSTADEQAAAGARPAGPVREGWLARRRLARQVVAEVRECAPAAIRISADALGRPLFEGKGAGLHLSFSARGALALIGIGEQPLGVDLEIETDDLAIPLNILRPDERNWLDAQPDAARRAAFLRIWTAKEAIVKALGQGFRIQPERIHLPNPQTGLVDIRILNDLPMPALENRWSADVLVLTREDLRVFVSASIGDGRGELRRLGVAVARAIGPGLVDPEGQ